MRQSKTEFFHNGVSEQKRPDIVIDLRRVDEKKIKEWPKEHKQEAAKFIIGCKKQFESFSNNLLALLKS